MREIRLHGSEGGGAETNRSFLPLSLQGTTSALSRIEGDTTHKDGKGCLPDFAEQSVPEIFSVPRYLWSHNHARKPAQWRITKRKSEIKQG